MKILNFLNAALKKYIIGDNLSTPLNLLYNFSVLGYCLKHQNWGTWDQEKSLSASTICSTTSLLQDAQDLFILQFTLFVSKDFLTEVLEGEREIINERCT